MKSQHAVKPKSQLGRGMMAGTLQPQAADVVAQMTDSFVGSASDGEDDGFVIDEGGPAPKRARRLKAVGATFSVAIATPGSPNVLWRGALVLTWCVEASAGPKNEDAHRRAEQRTARPGHMYIDYLVAKAVWLPHVEPGLADIVPPQVWDGVGGKFRLLSAVS